MHVRDISFLCLTSLGLAGGLGCGHDEPLTAASGGAGASATGGSPASGGDGGSGAAPVVLPSARVFRDDQVLEYHVTLAEADRVHLEEHGDDEVYVPATLVVRGGELGEVALGTVGIRHKGSWTLHHCWDDFGGVRSTANECAKLSYKLDFAEYDPDGRFEGLKKLNLHAAAGDATKLRELLGYGMFRDFGVEAPRIAPARVYVNGQFAGLFLAVEEIDGRFAEARFPAGGDGNLYKEVWPQPGLPDEHFAAALETNEELADVSDMQELAGAVGSASAATLAADLGPYVDLEALLRYVAVDRASKNWDGIMSFYEPETPHNFFWYRDSGPDPRFHLIPWDLDNVFWEFDPYVAPEQWVDADPLPDFNEVPRNCDLRSVWDRTFETVLTPTGCDPLLRKLAEGEWARLVELGQELLDGPLSLAAMELKLAAWEATLAPVVAEDPFLDVDTWDFERGRFRAHLTRAIQDFEAFLAEGYHEEQLTTGPELPEPTPEELLAEGPERGLVTSQVNNFEFTGGAAAAAPVDTFTDGETGTTQTVTWNTVDPLWGSADLRFDFTFSRLPGAWDEWVMLGLGTADFVEQDVSAYQQISLTLRADHPLTLRIRLASPAYDDTFGGAWAEFGREVAIGTSAQTVKLRFSEVYYPEWARAEWTAGQGWTTSDEEALAIVLRRFTGLLFTPAPTTDLAGEMVQATETGTLQLDNIYFQ